MHEYVNTIVSGLAGVVIGSPPYFPSRFESSKYRSRTPIQWTIETHPDRARMQDALVWSVVLSLSVLVLSIRSKSG